MILQPVPSVRGDGWRFANPEDARRCCQVRKVPGMTRSLTRNLDSRYQEIRCVNVPKLQNRGTAVRHPPRSGGRVMQSPVGRPRATGVLTRSTATLRACQRESEPANEFGRINTERLGEANDGSQRRPCLAALDRADERAVNFRGMRKALLGQPGILPRCSQPITKCPSEQWVPTLRHAGDQPARMKTTSRPQRDRVLAWAEE